MAQRTQYANAILPTYQPTDASTVVRSRLASAEHLNTEVADWFRERARIEEHYAHELDKLTRSTSKVIPELMRSGLFEATWHSLSRSVQESANASNALAQKIKHDIEKPLRRYNAASPQWQDMRVIQDQLDTLAQSYSESQSGKKNRLGGGGAGEARAHWEAQAPSILEQVETIDESRLGFLKSLLTTFGTIEADRSEKSLKISESLLNSILTYEPVDDVAAFAAAVGKGGAVPNHKASAPSIRSSVSESVGPTSSAGGRSNYQEPAAAAKDSSSHKLRNRVGSIFRSSKNKKEKGATPPSLAPVPSPPTSTTSASGSGVGAQSSAASRYRNGSGSAASIRQSYIPEEPSSGSLAGHRKPPPPPSRKANGSSSFDGSPVTLSAAPRNGVASSGPEDSAVSGTGAASGLPNTVPEDEVAQDGSATARPFKIDIRDGAAVPEKQENDDDDVALSVIASTLRQRNTISGRGNRGRRDIQSTLFTNIPPTGVESAHSPSASAGGGGGGGGAVAMPQETRSTPTSPPVLPPVNTSTLAIASADPSSSAHEQVASPVTNTAASIYSEQSSAAPVSAPVSNVAGASLYHPQLPTGPGLNASVAHVVSAVITDGTVSSAQVTGEIALNYQGESTFLNMRLGNLGVFENVKENDACVKYMGSPGVYALNTQLLAGASAAAFSFTSSATAAPAFVPVDFSPIWRIENNQSSLMLAYKVANAYLRESPIVLHDLVISVPVQGGQATSAVSKPHAVFNKAKQRIVWKFAEPVVVKAGFEERLLCRFATQGPAHEGAGGIQISFKVAPAPAGAPAKQLPVEVAAEDESAGHQVVLEWAEPTDAEGQWRPVQQSVATAATGEFVVRSEANVQYNF